MVAIAFSFAQSTQAAILANFTDGAGTSSYDQFKGIAGGGWMGAWGSPAGNTPTATVTNTSPINGSGNYLSVNPNGAGDGAIGRAFDGMGLNGGVDATLPVTISFDLRIDSLANWDANGDYISLHSSSGNYNVSGSSSFIIRAYGASPSAGQNGTEWLLYNGAGDGGAFSTANFVNSGMTLAAGTTYHFEITSFASTEMYNVSISNGSTSVNFTNLGWRANAAAGLQTNLAFNNRESSAGDAFGYSLDNINISGVPEPSVALLGGLGVIGLLRRRRV